MYVFGVILVNHAIQFVQSKRLVSQTTDKLFDDHDAETDHGSNDDVVKRLNSKQPDTFGYSAYNFGQIGSFKNCDK